MLWKNGLWDRFKSDFLPRFFKEERIIASQTDSTKFLVSPAKWTNSFAVWILIHKF